MSALGVLTIFALCVWLSFEIVALPQAPSTVDDDIEPAEEDE